MLVQTAYVHDPDSASIAAIAASEVSVGGYTRQTLAGKAVTQDDANNRVKFDAGDVASFGNLLAGQTVGGTVVFYDPGTGDANCIPIAYTEIVDTPTNGGAFGITWAAGEIIRWQI